MIESARSRPQQRLAPALRQDGRGAVGAVDVQPDVLRGAQRGQLPEGIDGPGVGRAGVRHHAQRPAPGRPVVGQHAAQVGQREAQLGVRGHRAALVAPEAQDAQGLGQRGVGLVGAVDRRRRVGTALRHLARRGHGREVRHRTAAQQDAPSALGQAAQLAQPVDHDQLDLRGRAGGQPVAHEDVVGAGQQVAHDAHEVGRARHEGVEARVVGVEGGREDVAHEQVEQRGGVGPRFVKRASQERGGLGARPHAGGDRRGAQLLEVPDRELQGAPAERAHLLGRELQRVAVVRGVGWFHGCSRDTLPLQAADGQRPAPRPARRLTAAPRARKIARSTCGGTLGPSGAPHRPAHRLHAHVLGGQRHRAVRALRRTTAARPSWRSTWPSRSAWAPRPPAGWWAASSTRCSTSCPSWPARWSTASASSAACRPASRSSAWATS